MKNLIYLGILGAFLTSCQQEQKRLPYLQQEITGTDTTYRSIPDFKFLNQDSVEVTGKDFDKAIYVADFFFTSCPTICPIMHKNMKALFQDFKSNPDVMFLSHTIDFKYDKPSVLKKYAQKLDVYDPKWQFVYGSKDSIYNIAEKSYLVAVQVDSNDREGYVHQGFLVLIDKDRRIRGAYDGTNPEQVEQLRKDIPVLLDEYKK